MDRNYIPFEPKSKTLKDFSSTVLLIGDCLKVKVKVKVKVPARSNNIWESKGPKKSQKGVISWTLNQYKKTNSQPHMLYWWNLPHIYLKKVFQLAKYWGVSHRVYEGVNKKTFKMSKKISFLAQFWPFLNTSKNCSISHASSCLSSLVKNVG